MLRRGDALTVLREIVTLGWLVGVTLLVPAGVGLVIDRRYGTTPWAILAGVLVGIILATAVVMRMVLQRYERIAPSDPEEEGP